MCEYKVAAISFKWRGCLKKLILIVAIVTSVCPEMWIFEVCAYLPEIKDCEKNKRRHIYDIGVSTSFRLPPSIIF
jgi:hypothetical protein